MTGDRRNDANVETRAPSVRIALDCPGDFPNRNNPLTGDLGSGFYVLLSRVVGGAIGMVMDGRLLGCAEG